MEIETILLELNHIEEVLIRRMEAHLPSDYENARQQKLHDLDAFFMKKIREIMLEIDQAKNITGADVLRYTDELKVLRLELGIHNFMHKSG